MFINVHILLYGYGHILNTHTHIAPLLSHCLFKFNKRYLAQSLFAFCDYVSIPPSLPPCLPTYPQTGGSTDRLRDTEMQTCTHANIHFCSYMDACMHTYIHTSCIDAGIRICIHTYIRTYIHTYMSACIHPSMHACMHACMHAQVHSCIPVSRHTCRHPCMLACVHIQIHTYVHACIHTYISVALCVEAMEVQVCFSTGAIDRNRKHRRWFCV